MDLKQETAFHERIEAQVERWDLFAKLAPTVFLMFAVILISLGIISFATAFWVGIGMFASTAVVWWFWTIYTIRHLIKTLARASQNLIEVKTEFVEIHKQVKALRNDE
jgi:ABC-type bacteriocin/lantibiotic exporter with double-glycine peptidase domain